MSIRYLKFDVLARPSHRSGRPGRPRHKSPRTSREVPSCGALTEIVLWPGNRLHYPTYGNSKSD